MLTDIQRRVAMQFQELVSRSGVSAARTKLYLREGLLAPGRLRNATRAEYDDRHVARLRMIDVLCGEGLSLAEIGPLCTALDDPATTLSDVLGMAQTLAVGAPRPDAAWPPVADLMARHDWPPMQTDAALMVESEAVQILACGLDLPDSLIDGYARAAELVADVELAGLEDAATEDEMVAGVVQGIRRYNQLLLSLVALARTSRVLRESQADTSRTGPVDR